MIAMEAIKGQLTINEIASDYGLHPNLVNLWRRQAIYPVPEAFRNVSTGLRHFDKKFRLQKEALRPPPTLVVGG